MKPDITEPAAEHLAPLWKRLAWFAAIWAASVMALGVVALAIRQAIG